jgi:hypothetical protein
MNNDPVDDIDVSVDEPYREVGEGREILDFSREDNIADSNSSERDASSMGGDADSPSGTTKESSRENFRVPRDYIERPSEYRSPSGISCGPSRCYAGSDTTRADLDAHYRSGSGKSVEFQGSEINLDYIPREQFNSTRGEHGLLPDWSKAFFSSNQHAVMFGTVTPKFFGNGWVQLKNDTYNFNTSFEGFRNRPLREVLTFVGAIRATNFGTSSGKSFEIIFEGATKIPFPAPTVDDKAREQHGRTDRGPRAP